MIVLKLILGHFGQISFFENRIGLLGAKRERHLLCYAALPPRVRISEALVKIVNFVTKFFFSFLADDRIKAEL